MNCIKFMEINRWKVGVLCFGSEKFVENKRPPKHRPDELLSQSVSGAVRNFFCIEIALKFEEWMKFHVNSKSLSFIQSL